MRVSATGDPRPFRHPLYPYGHRHWCRSRARRHVGRPSSHGRGHDHGRDHQGCESGGGHRSLDLDHGDHPFEENSLDDAEAENGCFDEEEEYGRGGLNGVGLRGHGQNRIATMQKEGFEPTIEG